jgi:hypothetical protein
MEKQEFYKKFIQSQTQSGQGLSGIVKMMGSESGNFAKWLDEFIKEGLAIACDTGGSMGHPESNIFYMPTKGYNVWTDDGTDGQYSRHKGRYLTNVRYFLKTFTKSPNVEHDAKLDENDLRMRQFMNPTMDEYNEWFKINEKALNEMLNLEEDYEKASRKKISKIKNKRKTV